MSMHQKYSNCEAVEIQIMHLIGANILHSWVHLLGTMTTYETSFTRVSPNRYRSRAKTPTQGETNAPHREVLCVPDNALLSAMEMRRGPSILAAARQGGPQPEQMTIKASLVTNTGYSPFQDLFMSP